MSKRRNPITWVPVLMFTDLGIDKASITFWTSLLILPWSFKPILSVFMELFGTKRQYLFITEMITALMFALVCFALPMESFFQYTLAFMAVIGLAGSSHDIAGDGLYLQELSTEEQGIYAGWQGAFYNLAKILANGGLVFLAGYLSSSIGIKGSWIVVMAICAVIMGLISIYHFFVLPKDNKREDNLSNNRHIALTYRGESKVLIFLIKYTRIIVAFILRQFRETRFINEVIKFIQVFVEFCRIFVSFITKKYIWLYLLFVLFYRLAEGFAMKIAPIFLKDSVANGGLNLSNEAYGIIYGTAGTIAFIVGSILAGYYVANRGLKKSLFSLVAIFNIPFLVYLVLAIYQPENIYCVGTGIVFEYFSYGFGFVGLTLFMMQQIAPGKYQMAHYAFANSLMNLSVLFPGLYSGQLSNWCDGNGFAEFCQTYDISFIPEQMNGYVLFFSIVMLCTIPVILLSLFLPFAYDNDKYNAEEI